MRRTEPPAEAPRSDNASFCTNAKRWLKTVANEKPATCQNHTLLTKKNTPKTNKPKNESTSAASAMPHACQ